MKAFTVGFFMGAAVLISTTLIVIAGHLYSIAESLSLLTTTAM